MSDIVYLMRGLPGSGKSTMAKTLGGTVIEPDQYFYADGVHRYSDRRLTEARAWARGLFTQAVKLRVEKIVIDRGNNLDEITRRFARYAVDSGYRMELVEPDNEFWKRTRQLLLWLEQGSPNFPDAVRLAIAKDLSERTVSSGHNVPVNVILERMVGWRVDLTVDDILNLQPSVKAHE